MGADSERGRIPVATGKPGPEVAGLVDIQPHSKTHANLTLRLPGETDARYRERIRREVETIASQIWELVSRGAGM